MAANDTDTKSVHGLPSELGFSILPTPTLKQPFALILKNSAAVGAAGPAAS